MHDITFPFYKSLSTDFYFLFLNGFGSFGYIELSPLLLLDVLFSF